MPPVVAKQDASSEQRANFFEALIEAKLGIMSAQSTLNARRSIINDADETRYIDIQAHELEAEYNKLHAAEIAFLANDFRFRPPEPATVTRIKDIVRRLDQMVAQVTRAQNVISAVTDLLNLWRSTFA